MSDITEILTMTGMTSDDATYCEECFAKIKADSQLFYLLETAERQYMAGYNPSANLQKLTEACGLHRYTVDLVMAVYCCVRARKLYQAHGYSDELFAETIARTIGLNVDSCKKVYGITGIFIFFALKRFFQCERFALGRLHFEAIPLPFDYKDIAKKGAMVLSCHIPASGPLRMEDVEKSFRLAYDFYRLNGPMVVVCSSWMLYPAHYEKVFPENSNLRRFYELFDVVEQKERDFTADAWRVFDTMDPNLENLPQNTTLQKNLYRYLKEGHTMGSGYGVLVRDYTK